ncbi:DEAD/DEAH box helicase [Saccharicrinis sp. GN24d3]|uniref:DEAD/DEAH box helicase n=1 Tax=Saccharicrinis sp. GN24d3 TaxID=3458416 RepID=UPI004036FD8E
MTKKVIKPYYQEYKKLLEKKLNHVKLKVESGFTNSSSEDLFGASPETVFLRELAEEATKHPMRYYQREAMYTLHSVYEDAVSISKADDKIQKNMLRQNEYKHISPLLEKVDSVTGRKAPFIGFEMATGSGKTMLMGAAVYYLNKMQGVKNFLIITPSSTEIYKKTIRNFNKGTKETVWHEEVPFKFNIFTGDNFKNAKEGLYDAENEANIFIFNIDKFGANATQTKLGHEGASLWKDAKGNTISLLEYLSQNDLVIITDEAHHAQNTKTKNIISSFKPLAVIEYTATAVETEKNEGKKNQTIVYKYDIRRFLEDQHGKKVRILALPGDGRTKGKKREISETERYKLQTFFLVHLLKKKAVLSDVASRDLKPIGFVKVKNEIVYAEKVERYIKEELSTDTDSLEILLEKAEKEDTETTNLILEMFKEDYDSDITLLQQAINNIAQTSILLHSKSDKLVKKQFDDIQRNKVEIVIFIDMLNEGIDMPNIFSMVIINDTPSEFKTSVKQIVGRGVRINREKRLYDEVYDNDLITHTEKLHIVADQGASFEDVVKEIQSEFGLTDKNFSIEHSEEKTIENKVNTSKLKGIQIPKIRIDFKRKEGVSIKDVIENYDKIIGDFLDVNSFNRDIEDVQTHFIKYAPNNFFTEVDLFADEEVFHKLGEDQNWNYDQLEISKKDIKEIYGRVIAKLNPIPDVPKTFKIFKEYANRLNEIGIQFYNLDDTDVKLAKNRFKDSFVYFYINYVENNYFDLDLDTLDTESDTWLLQNEFKDEKIKVRSKDIKNEIRLSDNRDELTKLIKDGFYFYGYNHSAYQYDKFDSYPEKILADYVNQLIEINPDKEKPFWIRNERNIFFEYGTHKYYPDFIFFYNQIIYVLEVKGEKFSNVKKNKLLVELNKVEGIGDVEGYKGLVVFEVQLNKMTDFEKSFNNFITEAEEYFEQIQNKSELISDSDVPEGMKYVEYVPAFEAKQAYNKYINHKEPKSLKWLKVKSGEYSKEIFATMVKDDALGAELKNTWVLMNSEIPAVDKLENRIIIAHHPTIGKNSYKGNLSISKFNFRKETIQQGLFSEESIIIELSSNDSILHSISKNHEEFKVVGVLI